MPDCEKAAKRDIDHTPNSRLVKLWTRNPPLPPSPQNVLCPSNSPAFQLLPGTAQLDGTIFLVFIIDIFKASGCLCEEVSI